VHPKKGIALRFPRFLRVREDKAPVNATSNTQVHAPARVDADRDRDGDGVDDGVMVVSGGGVDADGGWRWW